MTFKQKKSVTKKNQHHLWLFSKTITCTDRNLKIFVSSLCRAHSVESDATTPSPPATTPASALAGSRSSGQNGHVSVGASSFPSSASSSSSTSSENYSSKQPLNLMTSRKSNLSAFYKFGSFLFKEYNRLHDHGDEMTGSKSSASSTSSHVSCKERSSSVGGISSSNDVSPTLFFLL